MAQTDRFYIGMLDQGASMDTSLKPFAIPDAAFQTLNNAYVFRGRVRKRFGSRFMEGSTTATPGYEQLQSRFRINLGPLVSGAANDLNAMLGYTGNIAALGQIFSMGDSIFTVYQSGTMYTTGAITGTINTTTGIFSFTGALVSDFYFYPALPVMGLVTYETTENNNELVYGFDTRFAYFFTSNGWARLGTANWSGSDSDFFWGYTWNGISRSDYYLFVTNFVESDRIKYWNSTNWVTISPILNNTTRLHTARIILPFKDRLICLNTIEYQDNNGTPIGTTNGTTGNLGATIVAPPAGGFAIGQSFVVGTTIFTIASVAAGAQPMSVSAINSTGAVASATFDFATGTIIITGNNTNRNQGVYFLPNGTSGTSADFQNRCRYSINGSPVNTNSFLEVSGGGGGYIDAPVKEEIITAQFLKDRLIVYFEQSTWELAYTGNQILPFVWQQINTGLGAESTFSQISLDTVVLGVGNVGIMSCNGSSVERIDNKIPDEVFEIHNANNGIERVAGIRDYYVEMVYWSFPDITRSSLSPYNNKVLVYNYKTGSWALNDDSITAFGYYQSSANEGETWQSDMGTWENDNTTWSDGPTVQARFRAVLAGNQEGFVFIVDPDENRNAPALQITNMVVGGDTQTITITAYNHNLEPGFDGIGDYIAIENVQGLTGITNMIFPVDSVTDGSGTYTPNTFTIKVTPGSVTGTYTGGGTIARVSNIDILTKQYNFYAKDGYNASINKIDFLVDKTSAGQITVDYFVSSTGISSLRDGALTGTLVGNGTLETSPYALYPLEQAQSRLWHPIYPFAQGECIQLNIYMTDDQLRNADIAFSDFEWHAAIYYATRTSSRLQ